jgi:hypothetical protein
MTNKMHPVKRVDPQLPHPHVNNPGIVERITNFVAQFFHYTFQALPRMPIALAGDRVVVESDSEDEDLEPENALQSSDSESERGSAPSSPSSENVDFKGPLPQELAEPSESPNLLCIGQLVKSNPAFVKDKISSVHVLNAKTASKDSSTSQEPIERIDTPDLFEASQVFAGVKVGYAEIYQDLYQSYVVVCGLTSASMNHFLFMLKTMNIKTIVTLAMPQENEQEIYYNYSSSKTLWTKRIYETQIVKNRLDFDGYEVDQYHFLEWPENGIISPESLMKLIQAVPNETSPLLVHCSPSLNRTKVFVAAHTLSLQKDYYSIEIQDKIDEIDNELPNILSTPEQQTLIKQTLNLFSDEDESSSNWALPLD